MGFVIVGRNELTVEYQLDIIRGNVLCHGTQRLSDEAFVASFKKMQSVVTVQDTSEKAPFSSLGAYIDAAMFDPVRGYYTNKVNIGLTNKADFTTQLHDGLGFVFGVLVQAYNVWLTQMREGTRTANDVFNIVEPGAGAGIFALKLLKILDHLDIDSLQGEEKVNWLAFTSQLRLHLSDRSPLQVNNIKKTLADYHGKFINNTLLDKVDVRCCSLSALSIPADFLMIQEVLDVLPVEKIKFTKEGINVAIVIPTAFTSVDDRGLRAWLEKHSELPSEALAGRYVLSSLKEGMECATKWFETFVDVSHFPEIKQQVMQYHDYYLALANKSLDKTILIRRHLAPNLAPLQHVRGAAIIFDYGHSSHDVTDVKSDGFHGIRVYPQDDSNSDLIRHSMFGTFFGDRMTRQHAYLLKPGQYDITANLDFSEVLNHVSDDLSPIAYGTQTIAYTDHFINLIKSMPHFTADYINKYYLPAYQHECENFQIKEFNLESPFVVSLRLFGDYLNASSTLKQLMITQKDFAPKFQGHYNCEFKQDERLRPIMK